MGQKSRQAKDDGQFPHSVAPKRKAKPSPAPNLRVSENTLVIAIREELICAARRPRLKRPTKCEIREWPLSQRFA